MAAHYRLFIGVDRQFYWSLRSGNNEVLLTSEAYTSKQGAQNGIAATRLAAPHDAQYVRSGNLPGAYYFTLRGFNYETLGRSEMYSSAAGRDNGIASVKRDAPSAPVVDQA